MNASLQSRRSAPQVVANRLHPQVGRNYFAPQIRIICIRAEVSGNSPGSPRARS
jgi:hypothetical protein